MKALDNIVRRIAGADGLDAVATPLGRVISRLVQPTTVRNLLSGTWLGHAVHPVLTDLPIGAWSMATLLDLAGGEDAQPAADLLVGVGVLTAVPTAATGLHDWSDTMGAESRVGVVHAGANVAALGLYAGSLVARRAGHRRRGTWLGLAGLAALTVGGYLGGHLAYANAVNVNHTAFEHRPDHWTSVLAETELAEGQPRQVVTGDAAILLVRDGGQVHALANRCSHLGGPLNEGEIVDGCVQCPWHGSVFRLRDGHIVRGPASAPQPTYDVRVQAGQIEVRARA
ncbi:MAG: Rieske (2Fe-2S) protein [Nocardioidaceae bacterium]